MGHEDSNHLNERVSGKEETKKNHKNNTHKHTNTQTHKHPQTQENEKKQTHIHTHTHTEQVEHTVRTSGARGSGNAERLVIVPEAMR